MAKASSDDRYYLLKNKPGLGSASIFSVVSQTPPVGREVKIIFGIVLRPKTGLKRNDLSRLAKMMIASFTAKFDPIQIRGPSPKGR